jgi:hypothetical protein
MFADIRKMMGSVKRDESVLGGESVQPPGGLVLDFGFATQLQNRKLAEDVTRDWEKDRSRMWLGENRGVVIRTIDVRGTMASKKISTVDLAYNLDPARLRELPDGDQLSFYADVNPSNPSDPVFIAAVHPNGTVYQLAGRNTDFRWSLILEASVYEIRGRNTASFVPMPGG